MFGIASMLLMILQWALFLGMLAAIVYAAAKVAGLLHASKRTKQITGVVVGVGAFLVLNVQNFQHVIGKKYFEHLCETEAGEFIYRTVDNVEGVYQMRPRDPADYFDRMSKGDVPDDPYG